MTYPQVYADARRAGLLDTWTIARTPLHRAYPCRCVLGARDRCSPLWCQCSGRVDLDQVPAHCCAHRHTPAVAAAARSGVRHRYDPTDIDRCRRCGLPARNDLHDIDHGIDQETE